MQTVVRVNYKDLNDQIKAVANNIANIITENTELAHKIQEEYNFRLPINHSLKEEAKLELHRPLSQVDSGKTETRNFSLIAESPYTRADMRTNKRVLSKAKELNYWDLLIKISHWLDHFMNLGSTNLNDKVRGLWIEPIVEAAFAEDPIELQELSKQMDLNVHYQSGDGKTLNVVTAILDRLFNRNSNPIWHASRANQNNKKLEEAAIRLLDNGAIPEPSGYMPLAEAIKYGYMDLVKALIRNGFTLEAKYKHPVGLVWHYGSNFYERFGSLLDIANFNKQTEITEILKKEFPDLKAEISDYSKLSELRVA